MSVSSTKLGSYIPSRYNESTYMIKDLDLKERLDKLLLQLTLSDEILKDISRGFYHELHRGLEAHKLHPTYWVPTECSFQMLDTFISETPTGKEKGSYYALDFGGSNLRAVRIYVSGDGKIQRLQSSFSLRYLSALGPKGLLDRKATSTQLFDHFAFKMADVILESGDLLNGPKPLKVGFTFSFPSKLLSRNSAILIDWTKDFETGRSTDDRVEGKDVGELLNKAFIRNGINAEVSIVLNDTVGTMLSCAYQKHPDLPECRLGVILGTGFNICYSEDDYQLYGYTGKIINIECGNYDKNLPTTSVDYEIDCHSANFGRSRFEKLISGAYLGEIIRRNILSLIREQAPKLMWEPGSFTSADASEVVNDNTDNLSIVKNIVERCWGTTFTLCQLLCLKFVCEAVFERSAGLAAAAIVATSRKTRCGTNNSLCVAVDGSLYIKNPTYRLQLNHYIDLISRSDTKRKIELLVADDGSGKGAAIAAAMFTDDNQ